MLNWWKIKGGLVVRKSTTTRKIKLIDERVRVEGFGDLGRSEKIKWEIMRERE